METIPHRDLRNRSSDIITRVQAGETFTVTNHGEPVALLSPQVSTALERLARSGQVRPARAAGVDLTTLTRVAGDSEEILRDVRGDR